MEVRIEVGAERFDGGDSALTQEVDASACGSTPRLCEASRSLGRGRLQRALEVVHNRKDLGQDVRLHVVGEIAAFAFDPLAIVVELGSRPE